MFGIEVTKEAEKVASSLFKLYDINTSIDVLIWCDPTNKDSTKYKLFSIDDASKIKKECYVSLQCLMEAMLLLIDITKKQHKEKELLYFLFGKEVIEDIIKSIKNNSYVDEDVDYAKLLDMLQFTKTDKLEKLTWYISIDDINKNLEDILKNEDIVEKILGVEIDIWVTAIQRILVKPLPQKCISDLTLKFSIFDIF